MKNDTTILLFRQSETIVDPLKELARESNVRSPHEGLCNLYKSPLRLFELFS